jgi:hypothetical protein
VNRPASQSRRRAIGASLALVLAPLAARAQDPRASAAQRNALDWLALVDRGDPATSWQSASPLFRSVIDAARWRQAIEAIRSSMGTVVTRALASTSFHTEVPGLPDKGDYVLLVYRTTYTGSPSATERVTMSREADGVYRVAGYVIG